MAVRHRDDSPSLAKVLRRTLSRCGLHIWSMEIISKDPSEFPLKSVRWSFHLGMTLERSDWLIQDQGSGRSMSDQVLATHHVIKLVGNKLRLSFGDMRSLTVRAQHSMFCTQHDSVQCLSIVAVLILVDASFHQYGRYRCLVELGFPATQMLCRLQPPGMSLSLNSMVITFVSQVSQM